MDEKFNAILSVSIIPQIISLIITKESMEEGAAINLFYESKTYELLSKEETKLWHYSPLTLYHIWKSERDTGEMVFPEGLWVKNCHSLFFV